MHTDGRTAVQTDVRTYVQRNCSTVHASVGLAQARPNYVMYNYVGSLVPKVQLLGVEPWNEATLLRMSITQPNVVCSYVTHDGTRGLPLVVSCK